MVDVVLPYCYLFLRELNFAKMEQANFPKIQISQKNRVERNYFSRKFQNDDPHIKQMSTLRIGSADKTKLKPCSFRIINVQRYTTQVSISCRLSAV